MDIKITHHLICGIFLAVGCAGFLFALCQLIGGRILLAGKFSFTSRLERFLTAQAFGIGIVACSVFILGLVGGIRLINFITIYVVILPIFFFPDIKKAFLCIRREFSLKAFIIRYFRDRTLLFKMAIVLVMTFIAINLINSLIPPIGRDALRYHLSMPRSYIATGFIRPNSTNFFSYFPQLVEMLYTFGMLLSNDFAARFIHLYFGILTAMTIFMFARRFAGARAALFCALVFYSMPVVSQLSSWAYVDLALCFFSVLAVGFFARALDELDEKSFIISAVMIGLALSTKYIACMSVYVIGILFLVRFLRSRANERLPLMRYALIFVGISILVALPWYLRNFLITGNPVYPLFYSIFGGLGRSTELAALPQTLRLQSWDLQRATMYDFMLRSYGMGHSIIDFFLLPWRLAAYNGGGITFDGRVGMAYLAFTPFLLWFRPLNRVAGYILIYCAGFFLIWANLSQQTRFLLPALACLSICLYPIFNCTARGKLVNRNLFCVFCLIIAAINLISPVQQAKKYQPIAFIAGEVNQDEFLAKHIRNYRSVQYINTHLPEDAKTYLVFIGNVGYYLDRPAIQESVFEDYSFKKAIIAAKAPEDILIWFQKQGATHLLIDENMANRFLYSDITPEQLEIYKTFHKKNLQIVHREREVYLYQLK